MFIDYLGDGLQSILSLVEAVGSTLTVLAVRSDVPDENYAPIREMNPYLDVRKIDYEVPPRVYPYPYIIPLPSQN